MTRPTDPGPPNLRTSTDREFDIGPYDVPANGGYRDSYPESQGAAEPFGNADVFDRGLERDVFARCNTAERKRIEELFRDIYGIGQSDTGIRGSIGEMRAEIRALHSDIESERRERAGLLEAHRRELTEAIHAQGAMFVATLKELRASALERTVYVMSALFGAVALVYMALRTMGPM